MGNNNIGTGEKYFNPVDSSGFLSIEAIIPENKKRNIENARPVKNKTLEILKTISLPCPKL